MKLLKFLSKKVKNCKKVVNICWYFGSSPEWQLRNPYICSPISLISGLKTVSFLNSLKSVFYELVVNGESGKKAPDEFNIIHLLFSVEKFFEKQIFNTIVAAFFFFLPWPRRADIVLHNRIVGLHNIYMG